MRNAARRVVITGMGVVSPLGNSPQKLWEALCAGQSGVGPLEAFDPSGLPVRIAAQAREFAGKIQDFGLLEPDLKKTIRKGLKTVCREAQMGIAAAQAALRDAGLTRDVYDPDQIGAVFGSDYMVTLPEDFVDPCSRSRDEQGRFDFSRWAREGLPALNPLWLLKYLPNMPAAHLSMYNDLRGPNNSITQREASANLAVGEAAQIIARGHARWMVAGSTGSWIHPVRTVQAILQFELASDQDVPPEEACRPFDQRRSGTVLGEGAGAVVLEEYETARQRGATIYGEVLGAGGAMASSLDRGADLRQAMKLALQRALRNAQLSPEAIDHVNAHGAGTREGDVAEAQALADVFGSRSRTLPVVSAKGHLGNLGAGGGLVELIGSLLAFQHGHLFPTRNHQQPDPQCPLNVVTGTDTPAGTTLAKLNVTLQGQASCLVVRSGESS